jgi:hypothetical protein
LNYIYYNLNINKMKKNTILIMKKCFKNCNCHDLYIKNNINMKDYEKCYKKMIHNKILISDFLYRYWPRPKN